MRDGTVEAGLDEVLCLTVVEEDEPGTNEAAVEDWTVDERDGTVDAGVDDVPCLTVVGEDTDVAEEDTSVVVLSECVVGRSDEVVLRECSVGRRDELVLTGAVVGRRDEDGDVELRECVVGITDEVVDMDVVEVLI